MHKRGLSAIITSVLIILFSIVALTVIGTIIRKNTNDSLSQNSLGQYTTKFEINLATVSINQATKDVYLRIQRKAGQGDLQGFLIVLTNNQGNSETNRTYQDSVIKELETIDVHITYSIQSPIITVEVAPLFNSTNGKVVLGQPIDRIFIGSNGRPTGSTNTGGSQNNQTTNGKILLLDTDFNPEVWEINRQDNIGEIAHSINGYIVDSNNDCIPDENSIENCLNGTHPWCNSSIGGTDLSNARYMILDVEPCSDLLSTEPLWSERYNQSVAGLTEMLHRAKAARPDIKWSIYGIPSMPYWYPYTIGNAYSHANAPQSLIEESIRNSTAPQTVFDAMDFIAPSVYDPYETPESQEGDMAYIRDKIEASRRVSNGKPIFPYVWNRYWAGLENPSYALIPMQEFLSEQINSSLYYGANGVIWWKADHWFMKVALNMTRDDAIRAGVQGWEWDRIRELLMNELPSGTPLEGPWPREDIENHINEIDTYYLREIGHFIKTY